MKYIIPARKGSKGLRHKNRHLFEYTAKIIPGDLHGDVYVTSDDDEILKEAKTYGFNIIKRTKELSKDDTPIKHVLQDVTSRASIEGNITMLYLTYPKRTWEDVNEFINFYLRSGSKPTICKKEILNHPYLCYYEMCNFILF